MRNLFTRPKLKDGFTKKLLQAEKREERKADKQDVKVFKTFRWVAAHLGITEDLLKERMEQTGVKENLKFVSSITKKYKCPTIKELEELRAYYHEKRMNIRLLILILSFHHLAITRNIKESTDYTKFASEGLGRMKKIDEDHERIAEHHKVLRIIQGRKAIQAISEYKSREIPQEQETEFKDDRRPASQGDEAIEAIENETLRPENCGTNGGVSNAVYDTTGDDPIYEEIVDISLWIDVYIEPDTQFVVVIVTTTEKKLKEKENFFVKRQKYVRLSPDTEKLFAGLGDTILLKLIFNHPDTEIVCYHQSAITSFKINDEFIKEKEKKNVYFKLNPKLDKVKHTILEGELKISRKNETSETLIEEIPLILYWPVPTERHDGNVNVNYNNTRFEAQNLAKDNSVINSTQKQCTMEVTSPDKKR